MITTLVEVKARLGITDSSKDAQITALLDGVELELINETKNYFVNPNIYSLSSSAVFASGAKTITDDNAEFETDYFLATYYIYVMGSVHNDGYHLLATVAETILTLSVAPVDEDSDNDILIYQCRFPTELKNLIADMIGEIINKESGLKSESLGSHSVSYLEGYSFGLQKQINNFRKLFW